MKKILKRLTLIALFCAVLGYVALLVLDRLYPPDVSRYDDVSTIITDRNGTWLRVYLNSDDKYRIKTTHSDLPDDYFRLLINYEDKDFYTHHGIDFSAIVRAAGQNIAARHIVSGASTLTMQTARLLQPHPRSFKGKAVEAFRAWQFERRFSKAEILDRYATLAPVGGNREGLAAAVHYYLNKPLDKISLGETAWLVALTQSPVRLAKDKNAAITARNKVLKRAVDNGVISQTRYAQAIAEPLVITQTPFAFDAPHFSDYARAKKQTQTSLDKHLQNALAQTLVEQLPYVHKNANLAGAILDNHSGQWLAYVGSADFFNKARQGQVDMLQAVRSPGSTLKSFITLYAFDWLNYQPLTTIDDTPILSAYQPNNYDGHFQGRMTLSDALKRSRNVPAVRLLQAIKPDYFASSLEDNGLKLHFPQGAKPNLSLALGGVGIRGVELAELYRQLANCSFGNTEKFADTTACKQVTQILQQSQDTQGRVFFGREPVAFKTGTAYGWRDRWIFAYTNDYTIVLWSGRADGQFADTRASAEQLIPVLRQVVGILPNPPQRAPRLGLGEPTPTQNLPPRLRHVGGSDEQPQHTENSTKTTDPNALKIIAPLNNATIDFSDNFTLSFHIQGGTPPYLYLLNDALIAQTREKTLLHQNTSVGSYHLLVIDADGNSTHSRFRLQKNESNTQNVRQAQWQ